MMVKLNMDMLDNEHTSNNTNKTSNNNTHINNNNTNNNQNNDHNTNNNESTENHKNKIKNNHHNTSNLPPCCTLFRSPPPTIFLLPSVFSLSLRLSLLPRLSLPRLRPLFPPHSLPPLLCLRLYHHPCFFIRPPLSARPLCAPPA